MLGEPVYNAELQAMLDAEHAFDRWTDARQYAPVGCTAAELTAFVAGWQASTDFNARMLDADEQAHAAPGFRPLR